MGICLVSIIRKLFWIIWFVGMIFYMDQKFLILYQALVLLRIFIQIFYLRNHYIGYSARLKSLIRFTKFFR